MCSTLSCIFFSLISHCPLADFFVSLPWGRESPTPSTRMRASITDVSVDVAVEEKRLPKGETWSVHKFGGSCVRNSSRINNVADIIIKDDSERKLVVVSAMSKVTDMMYDLIHKAQSQEESYVSALDAVFEKHSNTAHDLLAGDDLATFLSQLHKDISDLKAMLQTIYIAGHATETFTDFVVGHGELWSAQILSLVIKKNGIDCKWIDAREVLIVKPTRSDQVDPDYLESERRLEKWYALNPSKVIVATGFIASTSQNIPTTLKRDGSDFSAAIMGVLFRARQAQFRQMLMVCVVQILEKLVNGDDVILKTMSYQEAWEMSYFGANVLHRLTIIPVIGYGIPIIVRNVFNLFF